MSGKNCHISEEQISANVLRGMIENVPGMIYRFVLSPDGQMTFSYVSSGCIEIYGVSPETIINESGLALGTVHPHDAASLQESIMESAANLTRFHWQGRIRHVNGSLRWIQAVSKPTRHGADGSIHWNGYLCDVTDQIQAQEAARRSQALLACLHQAQTQFITALDKRVVFEELLTSLLVLTDSVYGFIAEVQENAQGKPELGSFALTSLDWDSESSRFHGHKNMPAETRKIERLFAPYGLTETIVIANEVAPTGQPRPAGYSELLTYLGLPVWSGTELIGVIGIANRPNGYDTELVQFLDPFVSTCAGLMEATRNEQRRSFAEQNLRDSRHFLSRIADTTPEIIYIYDRENDRNVYANRELVNVLGYTAEEVQASQDKLLATLIHPEDFPLIVAHSQKQCHAEEGEIFEIEYRMRHKNGEWRWLLSRETPFQRNAEGIVIQVLGTALDITDKKLLQTQVIQSEKLAALGELVAGVAHEINNPLTAISGHCQLLETHPDARVQKKAAAILTMAERTAKIVRSLLSFARTHGSERRIVSLNALVEMTLDICGYKFEKSDIEICKDFADNGPRAYCNENQLEQVLLNLLNNAEYALRTKPVGSRILTLSTRTITEADGTQWGMLSVADTGSGIPAYILPHIFDPFFTTKDIGEGTGLGLSVCHGIIESHGGSMELETQVGVGTQFTLKLPARSVRKKAA